MLDLAIINGTVVTMDKERRVLAGGAVGIQDGRIVAVEPNAAALGEARETIDGTGSIVLPSIVDTHGHAGHSLTRELGEGLAEGGWFADRRESWESWESKLRRNIARDRRVDAELAAHGWHTVRVWESHILKHLDAVAEMIATEVKAR